MEKPAFEQLPELMANLIIEVQGLKRILLEKPNYESDEILNKRIDDTDLSMRAKNLLRGRGIEFVYEILNYSKNALMKFRNMGKKSLDEIEEFLRLHGLKLK